MSLKNKKALVGGSSGGIGKAIAQQLAASGASVTLMSHSEEKLHHIVTQLPTDQGQSFNQPGRKQQPSPNQPGMQ